MDNAPPPSALALLERMAHDVSDDEDQSFGDEDSDDESSESTSSSQDSAANEHGKEATTSDRLQMAAKLSRDSEAEQRNLRKRRWRERTETLPSREEPQVDTSGLPPKARLLLQLGHDRQLAEEVINDLVEQGTLIITPDGDLDYGPAFGKIRRGDHEYSEGNNGSDKNVNHESGKESDSTDAEDEWEVEKIVGKKFEAGKVYYKVKWKGWDEIYNSWEPPEHLGGCKDLLRKYEKHGSSSSDTMLATGSVEPSSENQIVDNTESLEDILLSELDQVTATQTRKALLDSLSHRLRKRLMPHKSDETDSENESDTPNRKKLKKRAIGSEDEDEDHSSSDSLIIYESDDSSVEDVDVMHIPDIQTHIEENAKAEGDLMLHDTGQFKVPAVINCRIRPFQREGVSFLFDLYKRQVGGILGDAMGLGKTVQALAFIFAIAGPARTTRIAYHTSSDEETAETRVAEKDTEMNQDSAVEKDAKTPEILTEDIVASVQKHLKKKQKRLETDLQTSSTATPALPVELSLHSEMPVLLVLPASLMDQWERELKRWFKLGNRDISMQRLNGKISHRNNVLLAASRGKLDVVLSTYGVLLQCINQEEAVDCIPWKCIMFDEIHKIKGRNSKTYNACRKLKAKVKIGLTGTVMQNDFNELWTLLDFVQPNCLGTYHEFKKTYEHPIKSGHRRSATAVEITAGKVAAAKLNKALKQIVLRRGREVIKDLLPGKQDNIVFCPLTPLQRNVYKRIVSSDYFKNLIGEDLVDNNSTKNRGEDTDNLALVKKNDKDSKMAATDVKKKVFPAITMLLKVSNHVKLLLPSPKATKRSKKKKLSKRRRVIGADLEDEGDFEDSESDSSSANEEEPVIINTPEDAEKKKLYDIALGDDRNEIETEMKNTGGISLCGKLKTLKSLLALWWKDNKKVLLFSKSTQMLDILEKFCAYLNYPLCRLDGSTPADERQGIVDDFVHDTSKFIFLMSTKAGGVGLNLVSASIVVVYDPLWNVSHDLQAQDRAYRIGQTEFTQVYRLISEGTIEEIVYDRQVYKQQLSMLAVEGDTTQKRYFEGLRGRKGKEGEIFGLRNLLRLNAKSLTNEILRKSSEDYRIVNAEQIPNSDSAPETDALNNKKSTMLQDIFISNENEIFDLNKLSEHVGKEKAEQVQKILKTTGVQYSLDHEELLRGSTKSSELLPSDSETTTTTTTTATKSSSATTTANTATNATTSSSKSATTETLTLLKSHRSTTNENTKQKLLNLNDESVEFIDSSTHTQEDDSSKKNTQEKTDRKKKKHKKKKADNISSDPIDVKREKKKRKKEKKKEKKKKKREHRKEKHKSKEKEQTKITEVSDDDFMDISEDLRDKQEESTDKEHVSETENISHEEDIEESSSTPPSKKDKSKKHKQKSSEKKMEEDTEKQEEEATPKKKRIVRGRNYTSFVGSSTPAKRTPEKTALETSERHTKRAKLTKTSTEDTPQPSHSLQQLQQQQEEEEANSVQPTQYTASDVESGLQVLQNVRKKWQNTSEKPNKPSKKLDSTTNTTPNINTHPTTAPIQSPQARPLAALTPPSNPYFFLEEFSIFTTISQFASAQNEVEPLGFTAPTDSDHERALKIYKSGKWLLHPDGPRMTAVVQNQGFKLPETAAALEKVLENGVIPYEFL